MLSSLSISDVKAELLHGFSYYSYATEEQFEQSIVQALKDTRLLDLVPRIDESEYVYIQKKDKQNLTECEEYIYWAEINLACAKVAENGEHSESSYSFSVEGYSESGNESSGDSGNDALKYYNKGCEYMYHAGYDMLSMRLR